jgi:hypothetical protein
MVIADLYLPHDAAGDTPPALAQALRWGTHTPLARGWRPWLARWFGRAELADAPVASIAGAGVGARDGGAEWLATPMHWVVGLRGVNLDGRAILRLPAVELAALAADFNAVFRHSGVTLRPLPSGDLLAHGPDASAARTVEPARAWLAGLAESLPSGAEASALRRLGVEVEMWLRDQAINRARSARGERPVSALWFWGGAGTSPAQLPRALSPAPPAAPGPTLALGSDAYLSGIARLSGAVARALPHELGEVFGDPLAARAAVVMEMGSLLASDPWTLGAALCEADRRFFAPALQALRRGACGSVTLLANDRCVALRPLHRLRFWRRPRAGLAALA